MITRPAPGRIDIWCAFCETIRDPDLLQSYLKLLSEAELAQTARFHFAHDRHRYVITRALLRSSLSKYADIAPESWTFTLNAYGRPSISNAGAQARAISFNLSHTRRLVALAISSARELGIDTEDLGARVAPAEVADRYFARAEVQELNALPPERRSERFFQYWTLKESYIKARGRGLSIPLDAFAFRFPRAGQVALSIDPGLQDEAANWLFWHWQAGAATEPGADAGGRHLLALCARRTGPEPPQIRLRQVVPLQSECALPHSLLASSVSA